MNNPMDVMMSSEGPSPLTEVLRGISLSRSFYCESTLTAPWGLENPTCSLALFHFVLQGGFWFAHEGMAPIYVGEGDLVLLPHGLAHRLCDTPDGPTIDASSIPRTQLGENASRMTLGGAGRKSFLICGGVSFEPSWHPLVETLPRSIIVSRQSSTSRPWLGHLFEPLKREAGAARPGGETIITRLAEVLLLAVIRDWIETVESPSSGWLVAMRHREIGQCIAAIHAHPHHPWTVPALASKAGMSRSVFSEHFTKLCGVPPAQYVSLCRMNLAGDWLQQTRFSIAEVADKLGYSSEATFSRAFKRSWGISPGRFRRAPMPGRSLIAARAAG